MKYFLRECPCRIETGNCKQNETEVCILLPSAPEESLAEARIITQSEALSILNMARARGDITNLFYKKNDKKFTEICSCCNCCCRILKKMKEQGFENARKSGYIVSTDNDTCSLCSECVDVCYFGARSIEKEQICLNEDICFGCEKCLVSCKCDAITLSSDYGIRIPDDL